MSTKDRSTMDKLAVATFEGAMSLGLTEAACITFAASPLIGLAELAGGIWFFRKATQTLARD